MKNRVLAMAFAALLSLGMVACEGGTATEDPGAGTTDGTTQTDGTMQDDGLGGGMEGVDDGSGDM